MDKISVKKIFILLAIFIVLAISITALLIFLKLNDVSTNNEYNITETKQEEIIGTKKNQKYNQNDLKIIKENVTYGALEYQTLRISGLKNKEIENKINAELESVENDFREKVLNASGENTNMYLTSFVEANYSNILSVTFYASKSNANYRNELNIHKYLNYDLTTGNHLNIEDLFVPNTDVDLLVQDYIYQNELHDAFSEKGIFFNPDYWNDGRLNYLVNEINELEFIKEYNKYKNGNKDFYITETGVNVRYSNDVGDSGAYIEFKKYLDKIVIFDKYVLNESIFETDDIGVKDLYVCSHIIMFDDNSYCNIKDVTSNFRIDARIYMLAPDGYKENEIFNTEIEKLKTEIAQKEEEFKKKANENKDKYYLIEIVYYVNNYDPKFYSSGSNVVNISYNKFLISKNEKSFEVSTEDFEDWFEDKIISAYTAENYDMEYQMNIILNEEEKSKCVYNESFEGTAYDLETGEVIKDLEDVFVEGVDYVTVIAEYMEQYNGISKEQTEEMIQNHEYHLEPYTIVFAKEEMAVSYTVFKSENFK